MLLWHEKNTKVRKPISGAFHNYLEKRTEEVEEIYDTTY